MGNNIKPYFPLWTVDYACRVLLTISVTSMGYVNSSAEVGRIKMPVSLPAGQAGVTSDVYIPYVILTLPLYVTETGFITLAVTEILKHYAAGKQGLRVFPLLLPAAKQQFPGMSLYVLAHGFDILGSNLKVLDGPGNAFLVGFDRII